MSASPPLVWLRSRRCESSACVEVAVARDGDRVLLRNSTKPDGLHLSFTRADWTAFIAGIRAGDFSVS